MTDQGERGSSSEGYISEQDQLKGKEGKPVISSYKLLGHEEIKQAIVRLTEEVKESFSLLDLDQFVKMEKEHREQIKLLIKAVTHESKRSVGEISRSIIGHGSSMHLAEKCIKEAEKEIAEHRKKLEDRKIQFKRELEEKVNPKGCKVLDDSQKVDANNELDKSEKHVTFIPLKSSTQDISKNRQTKQNRSMVDNIEINVEYNWGKLLRNGDASQSNSENQPSQTNIL